MRILRAVFSAVLFSVVLAACGGGGGSGVVPGGSIVATAAPGLSGQLRATNFSLRMPAYASPAPSKKRGAKFRRPANVSPPSIVFTVNSIVASTVNLTQGSQGLYFITIPMPVGTDTIKADLYDAANGTGNKIATGSTTATIVANATNTVNLSLTGIVASVCVDVPSGAILAGTSGSQAAFLSSQDADGDFLSGITTLPASVSLTVTGATNASFSPASISDLTTPVTFNWSTSASGNATLATSMPCAYPGFVQIGGPYLYVTNFGSGVVSVVNQTENASSLASGQGPIYYFFGMLQPAGVVFDAATTPRKVFVADYASAQVFVFNAETNLPITAFPTNQNLRPWGLALSTDGSKLFISESGTHDQVEIVSTATYASIHAVSGPALQDGSFVAGLTTFQNASNDITVVASRFPIQLCCTYSTPSLPTITNAGAAYDPTSIPTPGPLAAASYATAWSPVGTSANGTLLTRENGPSNGVQQLDLTNFPSSVTAQPMSFGFTMPDQYVAAPNAIAVSHDGMNAYAVGGTNNLVQLRWNGSSWFGNTCIALGGISCGSAGDTYDPVGVALGADNVTLYSLNYGEGTMSVVNTTDPNNVTVSYEVTIGGNSWNPFGIAVGTLPAGGTAFAHQRRVK
jgi:hypothetical protein